MLTVFPFLQRCYRSFLKDRVSLILGLRTVTGTLECTLRQGWGIGERRTVWTQGHSRGVVTTSCEGNRSHETRINRQTEEGGQRNPERLYSIVFPEKGPLGLTLSIDGG